ncbi:MAG: hypothetical protein V1831_02970 [Candidatus Woesearchaeota archaeon]
MKKEFYCLKKQEQGDDINEFRNGLKEYSNGLKKVGYVIRHGTKILSSHGK